MRKLLIVLGLVLTVLVAADFGLRLIAQYWVARSVQGGLGLSQRPSVSLGGFPFLVRLMTGELPSVDVEASGALVAERVPLHDVSLSLRHVHFSPGDLVVGDRATIRAGEGDGTITMTEQDVNQALPATVPVIVRLGGGGVTVVSGGVTVRSQLSLSDDRLVLEPVESSLPIMVSVRLPELVEGLTYTQVSSGGRHRHVDLHVAERGVPRPPILTIRVRRPPPADSPRRSSPPAADPRATR
jgi:LmeA-like phospholipid-binding